MGILDMFKTVTPAPAPQNTQQQTPQNTQQQTPQNSSGSVMIDQQQQKQNESGVKNPDGSAKVTSPLEPFNDLWDPTPPEKDAQGNVVPPVKKEQTQGPDFAKIVKNLDFSRIVNPEIAAKALGGDTVAFGQILNSVSQASVAAAGKMSHQITTKAVQVALDEFKSQLPAEFKKHSLANTPITNVGMKHKAARPLVEVIRSQIAEKYPELSSDEATTRAEEFLQASFKEMFPDKKEGEEETSGNANTDKIRKQASGNFNWDDYLGGQQVS